MYSTTINIKDKIKELRDFEPLHKIKTGINEGERKRMLSEHRKRTRELRFLIKVQAYLDTNPRKEKINSDIKKLNKKIGYINNLENYENWKKTRTTSDCSEFKTYKKELGFSTASRHLKTLNFIIDNGI